RDAARAMCRQWGDSLFVSVIVDTRGASWREIERTQNSIASQWLTQHEQVEWTHDRSFEVALSNAKAPAAIVVKAGDCLAPHALVTLVACYRERPDSLFVYSDEDCLDEKGR